MKKSGILLFALVLAVLLFSSQSWSGEGCCSAAAPKQTDPQQTTAPVKPYPLDTCIVSDAKLGSMGEAVVYVHEGQEVKFCCAGCIHSFKADPEKYLKKIKNKKAGAPPL